MKTNENADWIMLSVKNQTKTFQMKCIKETSQDQYRRKLEDKKKSLLISDSHRILMSNKI